VFEGTVFPASSPSLVVCFLVDGQFDWGQMEFGVLVCIFSLCSLQNPKRQDYLLKTPSFQ
jgi:hypothetical protein